MPAPKSLPTYVYKIVDSAPPSPLPDVYPLSELDKHDGFVHLSTSWQVSPDLQSFKLTASHIYSFIQSITNPPPPPLLKKY